MLTIDLLFKECQQPLAKNLQIEVQQYKKYFDSIIQAKKDTKKNFADKNIDYVICTILFLMLINISNSSLFTTIRRK